MKRVLITPLDWGLGHATRCIPVIRELQLQDCEIVIAGSGDSLQLLRKEFPGFTYLTLPGYHPHYPADGSMVWTMAFQLPRFLRVIEAEHKAIQTLSKTERFDLLISDNRYGCWSSDIPSVFITHQSNILMPKRFGWLKNFIRRWNDRMMNHFNACWIPDFPGDHSLAGDLISFGRSDLKINKEYIGLLSRFEPKGNVHKKYGVVAIFSGPEPQRTILENTVMPQLKASALKYLAVRGLPAVKKKPADDHVVNFLSSRELQECIEAADLIVARSGYSTVMDMSALGKKAVFIPTPGQTEQEYLAKRLMEKGIAYSMKQNEFNLHTAIEKSRNFSGFNSLPKNNYLKHAVVRYLE
jgi:uncharacterized protein (TIGR00661 family)